MVKRGRPFEPGNQYGCGRPRGSRNKRGLQAQQLLESHAESVVRRALVEAMKGDASLLRTLLSHILPRRRDAPVKTDAGPGVTRWPADMPLAGGQECAKTRAVEPVFAVNHGVQMFLNAIRRF